MTELKSLKKQLKTLKKRGDALQRQRGVESGTFMGDIVTLRKRVTQYEKHIKKLKQFVDKEDTEALVKELESGGDLPDLAQISEELQAVSFQVQDA